MGNLIWNFINLHNGEEDKKKVLENVTSNISFRGSNLWILACAIIIASVGLNVNSTAVIIGAMLISPLMGPIVGAGFALGTYNFSLLKKSIKNLFIATVVSLLVSSFYFFISPFKEVQSELLSRTSPTIYDVLIAFFGGLVGVIAITRVEKGNPIPGVAIATALMPPLCTAGYGLATLNFPYFFGAFYLYSINCFFICIATFGVVKYLNYPAATVLEERDAKKIRYFITTLIFIMIIPSAFLAYKLWNEKAFDKNVQDFINKEFVAKGYTIIFQKVNYNTSPHTIDIAFLKKKVSPQELEMYNKLLAERGIKDTKLNIRQNDEDLKSEILNEIDKQAHTMSEKDLTISQLQRELDVYKFHDTTLLTEMRILFPEVKDIVLGKAEKFPDTDSMQVCSIVLFDADLETNEQKLKEWLEQRLKGQNIILVKAKKSELQMH